MPGVVRFQGGHNAGHAGHQGVKTALQLIPSGIMRDGVACFIGNGVVVDPTHLLSEIERLGGIGLEVRSRLFISESCPLILPFHVEVDRARGAAPRPAAPARSAPPARASARPTRWRAAQAARAGPEAPERFAAKLRELLALHNVALTGYLKSQALGSSHLRPRDEGGRAVAPDAGRRRLHAACIHRASAAATSCSRARRARCSTSTTAPIRTSPRATAWPATRPRAQRGPDMLHYILGITEGLHHARRFGRSRPAGRWTAGHGRPPPVDRRPGARHRHRPAAPLWLARCRRAQALDHHQRHLGPVHHQARRARRLPEIKVCTGVSLNGERIDILPLDADDVAACVPIYDTFPGWTEPPSA